MDIEHLKNKRQKNVQEQNALLKNKIENLVVSYAENPNDYDWLISILHEHKLDPSDGVLVELACCFDQGPVENCDGLWLTSNKRFFSFEVELQYKTNKLQVLESWVEVTDIVEVNKHGHGTGKTFGYLAIEVLENNRAR